jgi:hypothetical protein
MLFTPAILIPAERLQTRNQTALEQEKIGTLFSISAQNFLDAKSGSAVRDFSLAARIDFVRRSLGERRARLPP